MSIDTYSGLPNPDAEYTLLEKIGEGTYGEVFLARHSPSGRKVAVKVLESLHEMLEEIETELAVLRGLPSHPNIAAFHGVFLRDSPQQQLWMVLELCSGGTVTDLMQSQLEIGRIPDEMVIAHIIKETMRALDHLHRNHIIHRDVKGQNILATAAGEIKLVDFGVSCHLKQTLERRNTSVGSPFWMAPEVIACERQLDYDYDLRCDTWSLGICLIELADGEPPLADIHPMRALFQIPKNPPPKPRIAADWSSEFLHFLKRCCVKDFTKREPISNLFDELFIMQVPEDPRPMRSKLIMLIKERCVTARGPSVTTKRGRLRGDRGSWEDLPPEYCEVQHLQSLPAGKIPDGADDLAMLEVLDEDVIVRQLHIRFDQSKIYTYIGDILLAVNPFQQLPLYSELISQQYRHANKLDLPPHIYAIADRTYQSMIQAKQNQCIIISGESGSGKTESANFLVQQLALLGRAPNASLEEKILQVNPLVEAFGNAKTVINENSSRFGKHLEMTFTSSGRVTGALISEYLLEKSRVTSQAMHDYNFHIFYYIQSGLSSDPKQEHLGLSELTSYRYLRQRTGASAELRGKHRLIQKCFKTLGFRTQEVSSIYCILSGILHLGNVEFDELEVEHQVACQPKSLEGLTHVSRLFGIDQSELIEALTSSSMLACGECINRRLTRLEANSTRDATSKAMYGRLFSWIVNKTNVLLRSSESLSENCYSIGILDIFGFENFAGVNSFEQLCINIANEQLQYYFNQHIFAWELQEYENEGILAEHVVFVDNRGVLDMFLCKPMGLLALLDEESHFPQASDSSLVEKFGRNIASEFYIAMKSQDLCFMINHYAGKVCYYAKDFLEKNRDRLASEIVSLMRTSEVALIKNLFSSPVTKTGKLVNYKLEPNSIGNIMYRTLQPHVIHSGGVLQSSVQQSSQSRCQQTLATYFRYSLMDLLSKMVAGNPHFIRCIRPNNLNRAYQFDRHKVEVQLRYTGVLETTRIRRLGFSHRINFADFIRRYYILAYNYADQVPVSARSCRQLLEKIGLTNWQLGHSKVFLKYYHVDQLSACFEHHVECAVRLQSAIKAWLNVVKYKRIKIVVHSNIRTIQKVIRGYVKCRHFKNEMQRRKEKALVLQSAFRGYLTRRRYQAKLKQVGAAAITLQSATKMMLRRQKYRKMLEKQIKREGEAALTLQRYFRKLHARSELTKKQLKRQAPSPPDVPPSYHQVVSARHSGPEKLTQSRPKRVQRAVELNMPWLQRSAIHYAEVVEQHNRHQPKTRSSQVKSVEVLPQDCHSYNKLLNEMQESSKSRRPRPVPRQHPIIRSGQSVESLIEKQYRYSTPSDLNPIVRSKSRESLHPIEKVEGLCEQRTQRLSDMFIQERVNEFESSRANYNKVKQGFAKALKPSANGAKFNETIKSDQAAKSSQEAKYNQAVRSNQAVKSNEYQTKFSQGQILNGYAGKHDNCSAGNRQKQAECVDNAPLSHSLLEKLENQRNQRHKADVGGFAKAGQSKDGRCSSFAPMVEDLEYHPHDLVQTKREADGFQELLLMIGKPGPSILSAIVPAPQKTSPSQKRPAPSVPSGEKSKVGPRKSAPLPPMQPITTSSNSTNSPPTPRRILGSQSISLETDSPRNQQLDDEDLQLHLHLVECLRSRGKEHASGAATGLVERGGRTSQGSTDEDSEEDARGRFNFRAALRKTHLIDTGTLRRDVGQVPKLVDFRGVLRKKAIEKEEKRIKRYTDI